MRRDIPLLVAFVLLQSNQAVGELVGFEFSGQVTNVFGVPFGVPVNNASLVSGLFIYDTSSPITTTYSDPKCAGGCSGYRQSIPGGFAGTIGGVAVSTDAYEIHISNDFQNVSSLTDGITIRWSSGLTPPLPSPLTVNGADQTVGLFSINLVGASNLFSDTTLPASLNLADFSNRLSFFSDNPTGLLDVFFQVASLSAIVTESPPGAVVPEPSSGWTMLAAILAVCIGHRRKPSRHS